MKKLFGILLVVISVTARAQEFVCRSERQDGGNFINQATLTLSPGDGTYSLHVTASFGHSPEWPPSFPISLGVYNSKLEFYDKNNKAVGRLVRSVEHGYVGTIQGYYFVDCDARGLADFQKIH